MSSVLILLAAAGALAQETTLAVATSAPASGSFWDKVSDFVKPVVGAASTMCSNEYVSGPYLETVFCDKIIPDAYTQKIGITFGADTDWCRGLACAYRAAGCVDPTYRVEAKVIAATGMAESCAATVGLDPMHCQTLAKFIAAAPATQAPQQKREVAEALSASEAREAVKVAAVAIATFAPETAGIQELLVDIGVVEAGKKRDISNDLLAQLQVCSPLIAAGIKLIESQIKLPVNVSDALGPCGTICGYAVCGLNILCQDEAKLILSKINSDRKFNGCKALSCAAFEPPGIDVCKDAVCPQADGFWQSTSNCLPPKKIYNPTKTDKNDCCQRCDEPCNGVICPATNCPAPQWPLCSAYTVGKFDQFDCCNQCIDPCVNKKKACPEPPTSCPAGSFLGPGSPGDCCLSCQPRCVGVACPGAPQSATACPTGTKYVGVSNDVTDCAGCCPRCDPVNPIVTEQTNSAAAASVAAAALATAAVANL